MVFGSTLTVGLWFGSFEFGNILLSNGAFTRGFFLILYF